MRIPLSILDLAPIGRGQTASDSFAAASRSRNGPSSSATGASGTPSTTTSRASRRRPPACSSRTSARIPGRSGSARRSDASQPRAAGDRRAVRHARGDLPGPDRPRSRPGARCRSGTTCALRRDPSSPTPSRRTSSSSRGIWAAKRGSRASSRPAGPHVPLYILGSSLFGAGLAAASGCPTPLRRTSRRRRWTRRSPLYRREFRPSEQLEQPYVIAGVNVSRPIPPTPRANSFWRSVASRAIGLFARARGVSSSQLDPGTRTPTSCWPPASAAHVDEMLTYAAVGTTTEVAAATSTFAVRPAPTS